MQETRYFSSSRSSSPSQWKIWLTFKAFHHLQSKIISFSFFRPVWISTRSLTIPLPLASNYISVCIILQCSFIYWAVIFLLKPILPPRKLVEAGRSRWPVLQLLVISEKQEIIGSRSQKRQKAVTASLNRCPKINRRVSILSVSFPPLQKPTTIFPMLSAWVWGEIVWWAAERGFHVSNAANVIKICQAWKTYV